MLVLTRRPHQSITVGHAIEITIVEVRGDQVRLGITAPEDISIHRTEIWVQVRGDQERREVLPPSFPKN